MLFLLRVFGFILGFSVFVIFLLHTFLPGLVHVDKNTFYFLSFMLLLIVMPTLKKGKLTYIMEFSRKVGELGKKALTSKKRVAKKK